MTTIWELTDDVIDYAIKAETDAIASYTKMSKQAKSKKTSKLLMGLAGQEVDHKRKLCTMKSSGHFSRMILDLAAIEESIKPEPKPVPKMSPKRAVSFAIKAENDAAYLYSTLAGMITDAGIADTFEMLAEEEKAHAQALES